jgi:hypothetical protein
MLAKTAETVSLERRLLRFMGESPKVKKKVKLSRYTPWRHIGGEEV